MLWSLYYIIEAEEKDEFDDWWSCHFCGWSNSIMYLFLSLKTSPSFTKYNSLINIYISPFSRLFIMENFIYPDAELYLVFFFWLIKNTHFSFETSKKPNWKEPKLFDDSFMFKSLFFFKNNKIQLLNNNSCSLFEELKHTQNQK